MELSKTSIQMMQRDAVDEAIEGPLEDAAAVSEENGARKEPVFDSSTSTSVSTAASGSGSSSSYSAGVISMLCNQLRSNWKIIVLGQCLSFLLASSGAAQATLHFNCGLSAPTFAMTLVYLGLGSIHVPILLWNWKNGREKLSTSDIDDHIDADTNGVVEDETNVDAVITTEAASLSGNDNKDDLPQKGFLNRSVIWYFFLAFVDVQANAITILAYKYTAMTSVVLFDALAIPSSMIISRCIVFRSTRRYSVLHYVGVIICMIGVVLNVLQDYESGSDDSESSSSSSMVNDEFPHKMRGDLFAILGGILYGLNNVLTEVTVSETGDPTEYLGMLGSCGFLLATVQSILFEREEIKDFFVQQTRDQIELGALVIDIDNNEDATCSTQLGLLLLFSFAGVTVINYMGASRFLIVSEAAFFSLSLLTGDLWSVAFSVFAERIVPKPLFFLALMAVLGGVVVYEMAPSPALEKASSLQQEKQQFEQQQQKQQQLELQERGEIGDNGILS